jgi:hypothetical protein
MQLLEPDIFSNKIILTTQQLKNGGSMLIQKMIFLLLIVLLSSVNFIDAQQENAQAEEMKAWTDYMTPGIMHEIMAKLAGDWKTVHKFWMDPAGKPMSSEGTAKTEMILGGRYQMSKFSGSVMGMPMEGVWMMGFDNVSQEFTAVWIDNMGTGTAIAKGKYDESSKTISLDGNMIDPISKMDMKFKQYLKMIDDNHYNMEMKLNVNGQEFKSMEIEFVRK